MKNPCKKTNTVFLLTLIIYLTASMLLSLLSVRSLSVGVIASLIFGEVIVVIPGLIFLLFYRCNLSEWIPVKKVSPTTIAYTVVFSATIMPFLYLLNCISQLFVENVTLDFMSELDNLPAVPIILTVGIIGPVCEEVAFRGILYSGYKRSGKILFAAIWSGLLFGLFHMNLNQLGYAFALGVISALLIEASGSIIPSFILHVIVNSYNVVQYYIADFVTKKFGMDMGEMVSDEDMLSSDSILRITGSLVLPAVIGLALAVVIYIAIADKEGRKNHITEIFSRKKSPEIDEEQVSEEKQKKEHIITFSGILGVIICLFLIFALEHVSDYIGL